MTTEQARPTRGFASDNAAGIHPEVLDAIAAANGGHAPSYGADAWTERLQDTVRQHFGAAAYGVPVFNGTGANVVALQAVTDRFGAVVCTTTAHIHTDECGAPEKVGGIKLLPVATADGKLTPDLLDREAWGLDDEHRARPQAVSITQSTELGTVYTLDEITALCAHAHELGLRVHMDGARLANAAVALGASLGELTTAAGVDIVSVGATKNGIMLGELVVTTDPDLATALRYGRKSLMQLGSKLRFVSAQLEALFGGDLWARNALHANAMARRLASGAAEVPGVEIVHPVQANAVFARLDPAARRRLQARVPFAVWDERTGVVRWMCAYDTTAEDVDAFVAAVRAEVRRSAG